MTSYAAKYRDINFREHPELYEIGRGEQGVLLAEPYKSEILPFWRFATSQRTAIHSQNIAENDGRVFITIYDSTAPEGEGLGVYIEAIAIPSFGIVVADRQADKRSSYLRPAWNTRVYRQATWYLWRQRVITRF